MNTKSSQPGGSRGQTAGPEPGQGTAGRGSPAESRPADVRPAGDVRPAAEPGRARSGMEPAVAAPEDAVAWRTPTGWRVGGEEVSDLTSAMVLADLLAADLSEEQQAPAGPPGGPQAGAPGGEAPDADAEQLKVTVAQLERALTVRVRVEQAIGVLAERHRLRPRQAFELLRSASRARGARVSQTASDVVASATNPLLRIPEELARPPDGRRGRAPRHSRRKA
jgi:ANTAR domain